jgi:hypothetical protein
LDTCRNAVDLNGRHEFQRESRTVGPVQLSDAGKSVVV